jgi:hypothetical protein
MPNPHLHLYRRHRRKCSAGHREGLRTDEYQERKDQKSKDKKWKACSCPIVMSGTLEKFDRRTTAEWDWEKARTVAAAREAAGSWDGVAIPKAEILDPSKPIRESATIVDATKRFLAIRFPANTTVSDAIQYKFGHLMQLIREFSEKHGLVMIDQWREKQVEDFVATWVALGSLATRHERARLYTFFLYCKKHWIYHMPLDPPVRSRYVADSVSRDEEKLPFEDEELDRMRIGCARYGGPRYKWTGQDLCGISSASHTTQVCAFRT